MIYFDNAATTFPKPKAVWDSMDRFQRVACANAGRSGHRMAIETGREIAMTRELVARLFNFNDPARLVFTANCTEAINLALMGLLCNGDHVIISSMEHNSLVRPLMHMQKRGVTFSVAPCSPAGELDPASVEALITSSTKLIACCHASNVTGTILPIAEIGQCARERDILFMVDAAQTAGAVPLDANAACIDLLAFPGHKGLLGPQGTGGLWIKEGVELEPLKFGGTGSHSEQLYQPDSYPDRYESGTLNAPGIVGLGAALRYILDRGVENIRADEMALTEYIIKKISGIDGLVCYGTMEPLKCTGIILFNFANVSSAEVAHVLDRGYGIAVRGGLHCAPMAHHTINTAPAGAVRVSLGPFNTIEQADALIAALEEIASELKG